MWVLAGDDTVCGRALSRAAAISGGIRVSAPALRSRQDLHLDGDGWGLWSHSEPHHILPAVGRPW